MHVDRETRMMLPTIRAQVQYKASTIMNMFSLAARPLRTKQSGYARGLQGLSGDFVTLVLNRARYPLFHSWPQVASVFTCAEMSRSH